MREGEGGRVVRLKWYKYVQLTVFVCAILRHHRDRALEKKNKKQRVLKIHFSLRQLAVRRPTLPALSSWMVSSSTLSSSSCFSSSNKAWSC